MSKRSSLSGCLALLFAVGCTDGTSKVTPPTTAAPGDTSTNGPTSAADTGNTAMGIAPTGGSGSSGGGGGPVPEPTTLMLLGSGLVMITRFRPRRAKTT